MKTLLKSLRAELKLLAVQIREAKTERKGAPNGVVDRLAGLQTTFRYKHITRCMLRGKTLEQIEGASSSRSEFLLKRTWLEVTGLSYPALPPAEVEDETLRARQA